MTDGGLLFQRGGVVKDQLNSRLHAFCQMGKVIAGCHQSKPLCGAFAGFFRRTAENASRHIVTARRLEQRHNGRFRFLPWKIHMPVKLKGEIVRADIDHVDSVHGKNFFDPGDSLCGFDHRDDHDGVIGALDVIRTTVK